MDGIYSITFRGATDWGVGMLLLRSGRIVGADVSGVLYDGTYRNEHGMIAINTRQASYEAKRTRGESERIKRRRPVG